ncbi:putative 3-methyladenine DNA glycosylase [Propionigenium maris DSM 9537]|uniref:Putative 3-methyladenine DNA glycosylase n=1 Tax=Propionigenium maris DSM 9537 TaxID=1123000 RepID=A0A9W6GMD5_9FUSO|nr:DNA-3-methyladenine glycosylase [Propionigenium maris]GLI56595.1 putative 3-methyladenine DNA glycosylase [Propionigenium maris DSM 9537]
MRLTREFYRREGRQVARELLGKILVRNYKGSVLRARIVETEAYLGPEDRASHAWKNKRTERTETMYLQGGHLYIYLIYGMYNCLNVVASVEGIPHAVLIRGVEPLEGEEVMRGLRNCKKKYELTNGPGKLCMALGIERRDNGVDLATSPDIWLEDDGYVPGEVVCARRVGIEYAGDYREMLWRYYIEGNPWVSRR